MNLKDTLHMQQGATQIKTRGEENSREVNPQSVSKIELLNQSADRHSSNLIAKFSCSNGQKCSVVGSLVIRVPCENPSIEAADWVSSAENKQNNHILRCQIRPWTIPRSRRTRIRERKPRGCPVCSFCGSFRCCTKDTAKLASM